MKHYTYRLVEALRDPVSSGDSVSWFKFYKMGAGVTCVPLKREIEPDSTIWFFLEGALHGGAEVMKVDHNINTNRYEAYFDSNVFLPADNYPSDENSVLEDLALWS